MTLTILHISDGKRGHDVQVEGLLLALKKQLELTSLRIDVRERGLLSFLKQRPAPDWVIGAGHATHRYLLAARWRWGCQAIVLMKPSWPLAWFSRCILPAHDGVGAGPNIITTRGSLNTLDFHTEARPHEGLVLIGGPSKHVVWNSAALAAQVIAKVRQNPSVHWQLTTSRRTPADFLSQLPPLPNLQAFSHDGLPENWLATQLRHASRAWVSGDSVNMVYEALTAGLRVGVLAVPARGSARPLAGIASLVREGLVAGAEGDLEIQPAIADFNEARRVAALLAAAYG